MMLLVVLIFGMLHAARGQSAFPFGKMIPRILWGAVSAYWAWFCGADWMIAVVLGLSIGAFYWLGTMRAWGLYFAAFTGLWDTRYKGAQWITEIGLRCVPWVSETHYPSNRLRGLLCMTLRATYLLPMVVLPIIILWLRAYHIDGDLHCVASAFALCPLVLLMGPIYWAMQWCPRYELDGVRAAENLTGLLFGYIIAHIITLI